MGSARYPRHLVRNRSPRLHVLQSRMVPCPFGFRRRSLPLVLAPHPCLSLRFPMGPPRPHCRPDPRCLFPNGVFLLLPLLDAVRSYASRLRPLNSAALLRQFAAHCLFLFLIAIGVLPTLITRRIVFGGFFRFGSYGGVPWQWSAPFWRDVLFSSDHGLLSWTPLLILALAGLLLGLLDRRSRSVAACFALVSAAFYYVFSSYPYWDGMASFGNRFFLSLTPIFVFGLAILFQRVDLRLRSPRWLFSTAAALLALFALWNAGLIYQWGAHLIPARGPVSFRDVAYNQVFVVPRQLGAQARVYLFRRSDLMRQIEQRDIDQLSSPSPPN